MIYRGSLRAVRHNRRGLQAKKVQRSANAGVAFAAKRDGRIVACCNLRFLLASTSSALEKTGVILNK